MVVVVVVVVVVGVVGVITVVVVVVVVVFMPGADSMCSPLGVRMPGSALN